MSRDLLTANGGSKRYTSADSAVTGIKGKAFRVSANAVIGAMAGTRRDSLGITSAIDFLTEFNISAVTLDAGDLYIAAFENGFDDIITGFTVTSGTIIVYS